MNRKSQRALLLAVPLALAATACGSGGDTADPTTTTAVAAEPTKPSTTEVPAPTTETTPVTSDAAPVGVTGFGDVQPAVVQIVAQGTFRDPEVGFADGSGLGSGFIISPDGLAVTNNHVVAGAATLEVYIGGDLDESYNATILGVSECNDLALIDINGPDDLPYLEWFDGDLAAGLDVYAAGYPLGNPEFTLTRGIVSKVEAPGDLTGTSSIDHTLEHDASIQPGNSGGPLVDAAGQVVAVNYAGGAMATTTEQFWAIAADLAEPVVEELKTGDFESLGINGWAVYDEAMGIAGIWVAGVAPGSPAAEAEILPGDIVTSMNGLPVGTDGTFKDYCDVIRTAGEGAPINVEVLRFDTSEVLKGEINGNQPLEMTFSFAAEVADEVGDESDPAAAAYTYDSVTDDLGQIYVDVPTAWSERDTAPGSWEDGSQVPYIAAAPDLDAFLNGFDVPGLIFAKLPMGDVDAALGEYGFAGSCTDGGITDYSDAVFTGKYQVWQDCGGTANDVVTLAALPAGGSYMAVMVAQIVTDADLA
ncbi:MAG TPA: trypsin-like peptidase domain-containing protein, partial [Desertimonas sp.]|nr:trypsin-like peptidase domain-containing protein [Desertimonas sp.]